VLVRTSGSGGWRVCQVMNDVWCGQGVRHMRIAERIGWRLWLWLCDGERVRNLDDYEDIGMTDGIGRACCVCLSG
jgi:hypothetical protein